MTAWHRDALCTRTSVDFFDGPVREAKAVCAACPVTAECLTATMRLEADVPWGRYGVAGGLTAAERERLGAGRNVLHGNTRTDPQTVLRYVTAYEQEHGRRYGAIKWVAAELQVSPGTVTAHLRRTAA
jgi:hypothetical protein